ncbi:MAG: hypothetical protein K0Q63_2291 [Paenibacillus sp.]|nr:hypothetical protein [Paenibacillus sp.]
MKTGDARTGQGRGAKRGDRKQGKKAGGSALGYRTRWIAWSLIVFSMAGCLAAAIIRGGALEWYASAVLLGITVFSGLLPLFASRGISAVRHLPADDVTAGDEAEIKVAIERRWRMPWVWISVQERAQNGTVMTPSAMVFHAVALPGAASRTEVVYSVRKLRRGVYVFREMTVTVGDWLGLTAIRRTLPISGELPVWPAPPAHAWSERAHQGAASRELADVAALAGSYDWRGAQGDSISNKLQAAPGLGPDSRPYREGDSLRHLDIRAAARGRGFRVKSHAPERPQAVTLWIDTSAEGYGHQDARFEACIGRTALEARRLSGAGACVRVATTSWTIELNGEETSRDRHRELLDLLARLRADEGRDEADAAEGLQHAAVQGGEALHIFSGDWRTVDRWLAMSAHADRQSWQSGGTSLHLAMEGELLTQEMRDNGKRLEEHGFSVSWIPLALADAAWPSAGKGAESHAIG